KEPTVRALLDRLHGGSVLDVGCGTGRHLAWQWSRNRRVIGVDQSAAMLERSRVKLPARSLVRTCSTSTTDGWRYIRPARSSPAIRRAPHRRSRNRRVALDLGEEWTLRYGLAVIAVSYASAVTPLTVSHLGLIPSISLGGDLRLCRPALAR